MKKINIDAVSNICKNIVKVKVKNYNLNPLVLGFYITLRCNLKCLYCDYPKKSVKELGTEETIKLLEITRKKVPAINITGGEPLLRDDIVEIVRKCKNLKYLPVTIFTNSLLLEKRERILDYVDFLFTSLDNLNEEKYDRITQVKGSAKKIKNNIEKYSKLQEKKDFVMDVNCVINAGNLDDVLDLAEFVFDNNTSFSVEPQISFSSGLPSKDLVGNEKYKYVIDELIKLKKRKNPILNSLGYLRNIKNFSPFNCHPFLIPRVFPNGDLFYPCGELGMVAGNLLIEGSWDKTYRKGVGKFGTEFKCSNRCHYSCYVEPSIFIEKPMSLLRELLKY